MRNVTVIAVLVFSALFSLAIIRMNRKSERGISHMSFKGVDKSLVDHIEIKGPHPIDIKQKDGKWTLADGKPADENAVKQVLEATTKIETSDVVTQNPDRYAEFEVDDAKGVHVQLWAGAKTLADFYVGKPGGSGTRMRVGEIVYAVQRLSGGTFSKPASAWHQLKLFTDKLDDVSRVEVALAGQAPYALVKNDKSWSFENPKIVPEGFRFDENAAKSMVSALVNMSAKEMLDKDPGADTTKLDKTNDVLVFVTKDGRRELHLGASLGDKSVYAKVTGKDDLYTLAEFSAKGLRKDPLSFRDLTVMKFDTTKVQKLTIVDQKAKVVFEKEGTTWKTVEATPAAPPGFEFDPMRVTRRLASFANTRAVKLAPESAGKNGLPSPKTSISATLEGGTVAMLEFGAESKEDQATYYAARGNVDGSIYLVAKQRRDELLGDITTFKKQAQPSAPQFDASQLANLPPEVRASLMKQLAQRQGMPGGAIPVRAPPPPPKAP